MGSLTQLLHSGTLQCVTKNSLTFIIILNYSKIIHRNQQIYTVHTLFLTKFEYLFSLSYLLRILVTTLSRSTLSKPLKERPYLNSLLPTLILS